MDRFADPVVAAMLWWILVWLWLTCSCDSWPPRLFRGIGSHLLHDC